MKFAEYVAWILLCKHGKFGEKNYCNSRDIEFFLWVYFSWRVLYSTNVKAVHCDLIGLKSYNEDKKPSCR